MAATSKSDQTLLVRLSSRYCALPLENIVEAMRPLPIRPVQGMPSFVRGIATIRGSPVPVVDLGVLFDDASDAPNARFVLLQLGERRLAVCVNKVLGIRQLDDTAMQGLPPLLHDAYGDVVAAIEVRDNELLFFLRSTNIIPEEVWERLESGEVPPT